MVEGHELVNLVHAVAARVWHNGVAELAAAEQASEELIEMGEKGTARNV